MFLDFLKTKDSIQIIKKPVKGEKKTGKEDEKNTTKDQNTKK